MTYIENLTLLHRGKTRDTYEIDEHFLLIVASDRVSTHNVVHSSDISKKGEVLTALTVFWLEKVLHEYPHHLVAFGRNIFDYLPGDWWQYPKNLSLRAIVVRRLSIIPIEFIFRNYLCGSLYSNYYEKGIPNPYGLDIPAGLPKMCKFDAAVFTPTEKSKTDDPTNAREVELKYKEATELAKSVFLKTRSFVKSRNLEIIDGKLEIGVDHKGQHFLADEVATPDSSRYTILGSVRPGQDPIWLDKQILRDEAESVWAGGKKEPLLFSTEITAKAKEKYKQIFHQITGKELKSFQDDYLI